MIFFNPDYRCEHSFLREAFVELATLSISKVHIMGECLIQNGRRDEEIRVRAGMANTSEKKARLRWLGHMERRLHMMY